MLGQNSLVLWLDSNGLFDFEQTNEMAIKQKVNKQRKHKTNICSKTDRRI